MSFDAHVNFGYGTVLTAPTPAASGTSLTLDTGQGALMPAVPFNAVVWPVGEQPLTTNAEIVRVTNRVGDVLTLTRTQEGSSARTILVGDQFGANITAKIVQDLETVLAAPLFVSAGASSASLSALTFSNASGVSFGLSAGTLTGTVQTNYLTTAMASNRGSDFVQAAAVFNGTNASGTIASNALSISVNTGFHALTLGGNTAGTTTFHASNNASLFIHGGNNITVSGNGSSVTISGANAGGVQTGISGIVVSDTTYTSGTVSFSNQGNVTIGSSVNGATQYIRLSVAAQTNQTGISGVVVSDTTYTSGTVSFSNAGNITISSSVNGATQYIRLSGNAAQTNQSAIKAFGVSNTGQTAGNTGVSTGIDWVMAGSQSITLSQSTAAGGPNTVWLQHPAWLTTAMQSNAATISNINVSGGTTSSNLSALKFIDSQGVSWSLDTGSKLYATVKTDYLTSQSTQFIALTLGGNTAGTTTFHATNNASLFLHGGNNITLSGNGSSVTISAAAGAGQSAIEGFGVSNTGQTAGNTGISTGVDWVLAGSGSITLSQSTAADVNTVWIQHPAWLTTAMASDAVTLSNIRVSAGTTSNLLSRMTFADGSGVSWGINDSTITASVSAPRTGSYFANLPAMVGMVTGGSAITQTSGSSIFIQPFFLPYHLSIGWVRLLASFNDSAVGTGGTPVVNSTFSVERYTTFGAMIFSQGVGASSRSLQLVTSTSEGLTGRTNVGAGAQSSRYTVSIEKSYPVSGTTSSYTSSYAVSSASIVISSNSNTLFTGPQFLDVRFGVSLNPGNYWFGIGMSANTATQSANISFATSAAMAISLAGVSNSNVSVGLLGAATSASDHQLYRGLGVWTTNASRYTTDSVGVNSISQVVSNPQLPIQFIREA